MYQGICETIHHELDLLEDKFQDGSAMSEKDLEMIDKMAHALKSLATYDAMKGHSEYDGNSYRRGRSMTTGRYVSRDDGRGSYDEYRRY